MDERPVVVGSDGSDESEAAVHESAALFRDRTLVVVSVWEPALAVAMTRAPDDLSGLSSTAPEPESMAMIDGLQRVLAGACVVRLVLTKLGCDSLVVSDRGLRHRLIADRRGLGPPVA